MYTFHSIMSDVYSDCGEDIKQFPYHWLRASWYHDLNILDIDYPAGFTCPKCGDEPKTIVCDATSLAFRRDLLPTKEEELPLSEKCSIFNGRYVTYVF